ncbi:MAG: hypothetical protein ACI4JB_01085 [Porcipelethomonas sp.]
MKKSVYSLVLMDDVVEAIDEMAYRMNTSRSNLINQILAEHVSYVTPERKMRDIFECVRNMMDSHFQIQGQASDAMLSIRSPLRFKYKPTIRYRVELLKEMQGDTFGMLTVSFRTQSVQLIDALHSFFAAWSTLENKYQGELYDGGIEYEYSDGKFMRKLKIPCNCEGISSDELGEYLGEYIKLLDSEIKIYFAEIEIPEIAVRKIELFYKEHADSAKV